MLTLVLFMLTAAVLTAWIVHDVQAWAERRCARVGFEHEPTAAHRLNGERR